MDEIKWKVWYVVHKNTSFHDIITDIFKNGLWQCMVCSSLTRDFLSSCHRLQFSQYKHHVCLCSFQVFTNLHRHCKGGNCPPPISNQYIDSVEQLNYCLVFWILATFVSTTKVFLVWYQTNTCCHVTQWSQMMLLSCEHQVTDHLGMSDTIVANPLNSKKTRMILANCILNPTWRLTCRSICRSSQSPTR